ncbi:MAG TPA: HAD-IA family hydrolase [Ktedonobacteraceae bacterium]|jgi:putative hydrolase of the HAD superfamily|nr:HAD-IA family hydrolase [Ktedonobacteraceae bacterium]
MLSNTTPQVRKIVTQRFHLEHLFDAIVVSAEVGVKKPESEIYRRALQMLQLAPQEAIFVDDDQMYVEAVRKPGMYGISFSAIEQAIVDICSLLKYVDPKREKND